MDEIDPTPSRGAEALPGLDLDALAGFLGEAVPGLAARPLSGSLIAGGKSNLTYRVTDGTRVFVVRRPPLGHVLETAHDMGREHRVITALRPTGVPVPEPIALCADPDVIGAPFYVMSFVEGDIHRTAGSLRALGPERTTAISKAGVATLAALHAVDPAAVGLADFGRPEGFVERQVRRWGKQLEASRSRDLPGIDTLYAALAARIPPEQPPAIVHGDYRIDNLVIGPDDTVDAVLDWEMSTLGDPLTDLGLMRVYEELSAVFPGIADAPSAPGFTRGADAVDAYVAAGGRPVDQVDFYVALAAFKLAVILEGIHLRHAQGMTAGGGFDNIGDAVPLLIDLGHRALSGD
jgi:aminoglycoside phosphotransferase (APT) family kinase protein